MIDQLQMVILSTGACYKVFVFVMGTVLCSVGTHRDSINIDSLANCTSDMTVTLLRITNTIYKGILLKWLL